MGDEQSKKKSVLSGPGGTTNQKRNGGLEMSTFYWDHASGVSGQLVTEKGGRLVVHDYDCSNLPIEMARMLDEADEQGDQSEFYVTVNPMTGEYLQLAKVGQDKFLLSRDFDFEELFGCTNDPAQPPSA